MSKNKSKKNQMEETSIDKGLTSNKYENKLEEKILEQLNNLNHTLNKNKILDLVELIGDTKKFLFRNFTSGIVKGIGIGIGVTIITAIIIYILQKIIKLNIPIISQYIADIVEIVQNSK